MSEPARPVTTYLVGTAALAVLLVVIGLGVQSAVMARRPPEIREAPAAELSATSPPLAVLTERTVGLCEVERVDGQQPIAPASPATPMPVHLRLPRIAPTKEPTGAAGAAVNEGVFVLLVAPDGKVQKIWPVWTERTSPDWGRAVLDALEHWKLDPGAAPVKDARGPTCLVVAPDVHWE